MLYDPAQSIQCVTINDGVTLQLVWLEIFLSNVTLLNLVVFTLQDFEPRSVNG